MARRDLIFRVFVSSTFSDLIVERDVLQRLVFPMLREHCRMRNARFQAIDLRWGVSQEASLNQQTMNICIQELERCQEMSPKPNFLVLLMRSACRPLRARDLSLLYSASLICPPDLILKRRSILGGRLGSAALDLPALGETNLPLVFSRSSSRSEIFFPPRVLMVFAPGSFGITHLILAARSRPSIACLRRNALKSMALLHRLLSRVSRVGARVTWVFPRRMDCWLRIRLRASEAS